MSVPDSLVIRQACALLAQHLEPKLIQGNERIWLRPGTNLSGQKRAARANIGKQNSVSGAAENKENPATRLARLAEEARTAVEPRALGTLRDTFVFSTGNPFADLVFVGEAPGAEEEKAGEPFVGPAGALLDKIIKAMGLNRSQVYITNVVKFRPKIEGDQGRANRKPTPQELASCLPIVQRELAIIEPKVIVALGGSAFAGLTGTADARVNQARGRFHTWQGIPLMVTFHPSYLLRQSDEAAERSEKRKLWEDMLLVMEKLGLPISERQRGYFKSSP